MNTRERLLLLAILAASVASSQSVEPWSWRNPLPQGNALSAVAVNPSGMLFAVGDGGTMLTSIDDGDTWQTTIAPAGLLKLHAVAFPTASVGYLAGEEGGGSGRIARTTNGGLTWSLLNTGTINPTYAFSFRNDTLGWAVGAGGGILRTTNKGATWTQQQVPGVFASASAVDANLPLYGFAVGAGGTLWQASDGGNSWSAASIGRRANLYTVRAQLGGSIIAAGDSGLVFIRSTDDPTWTTDTVGGLTGWRAVTWLSTSTAVLVGQGGAVQRSENINLGWAQAPGVTTDDLLGVAFRNTSTGWAVGANGTIIRSTDGGATWSNLRSGPSSSLNSVVSVDRDTSIAVGTAGSILRSTAAGGPWVPVASGTGSTLRTVLKLQPGHLLALGNTGVALSSSDGGTSWSPTSLPAVVTWYGAALRGSNVLAVGASGTIVRSTDGGGSWASVASGTTISLRSVAFADDSVAVAVGGPGGGNIVRSTNAGATWDTVTHVNSAWLTGVAFLNKDVGVATGYSLDIGLPPTLLRTTDGGISWTKIVKPATTSAGFNILTSAAFNAQGKGIIVGSDGVVYTSTDQGVTWDRLLIGTSLIINQVVSKGMGWLIVGASGSVLESPDALTAVSEEVSNPAQPVAYGLIRAFPNPFNPVTTIEFSTPVDAVVRLTVHDLLGREVALAYSGWTRAGDVQRVQFDATGLSSGVYIARLRSGGSTTAARIMLLR